MGDGTTAEETRDDHAEPEHNRRSPGKKVLIRTGALRMIVCMLLMALIALLVGGCGVWRLVPVAWYRYRIGCGMKETGRLEPAHLDRVQDLPVLHLYGSHEEMGRQYGTLMQKPLRALDSFMRCALPPAKLTSLLAEARAREPALPEAMRTELKAMAEASGVPYVTLVGMNTIPHLSCTVLAAWDDATPDGQMIVGRNAEYFSFGLHDRATLLVVFHPDDGLPVLAVGILGMIGAFTGINEEGVVFANLLVFNSAYLGSGVYGLPIQLAMRQAAHESATAAAARDVLLEQRHTIPISVLVADPCEAFLLELTGGRKAVRGSERGLLVGSNYFRAEGMAYRPVRCPYYEALAGAGQAHYGKLDVPLLEQALHEARRAGMNLQAVVFEPAKMVMHLSANKAPASAGPYRTYDLEALFRDESH